MRWQSAINNMQHICPYKNDVCALEICVPFAKEKKKINQTKETTTKKKKKMRKKNTHKTEDDKKQVNDKCLVGI